MTSQLLSRPTRWQILSSEETQASLVHNPHHEIAARTTIGNYRIESFLDRGGMASVYEATDLRLNRPVALKVLAGELAGNSDFRASFVRESRFAASLEHPNIVPIYDAGEIGGLLYIAMRLVRGTNLAGFLGAAGPLETAQALDLLAPAANALDAAHAAGLIHRDVKPANLLLAMNRDGRHHVYLADFGLTKLASARTELSVSGTFAGTAEYNSPEQIRGEKLDSRSDQYALGCVAYQCLTGSPPFVRDDQAALLWAHLAVEPPPVSALRKDLARADAVLARCLAKSPRDRYETCGQFIEALADTACTGRHRSASVHEVIEGDVAAPHPASGQVTDLGPDESGSTQSDPVGRRCRSEETTTFYRWVPPSEVSPGSPPSAPDGRRMRPRPQSTRPRRTRPRGLVAWAGTLVAVLLLLAVMFVINQNLEDTVSEPAGLATASSPPPTTAPSGEPTDATTSTGLPPTSPPALKPSAQALAIPSTFGPPIEVGSTPGSVAITTDGRLAYVTHREAGFITVVDTATDRVSARIAVTSGLPQFVAVTPDSSRAYVSVSSADETANAVAVLDTRTSRILSTIPVDRQPMALTVGPDQRYVFVPSRGTSAIDVLDSATGRMITKVAVPANPYSIRISPDGSLGYIADRESNLVSVLDTANYQIVGQVAVGTGPRSVAVSPDGTVVAVVCSDSNDVYFIDTDAQQVIRRVPVGVSPQDAVFTPDGRYVYTANVESGTVSVIETATGAVTANIPTPSPTSVSILPDGTKAYVTNMQTGTVTVLHAGS